MKRVILSAVLFGMFATSGFADRAMITVKVAEETGEPVAKADVRIGFFDKKDHEGSTGTNGLFSASGNPPFTEISIFANKDGYYNHEGGYKFSWTYDPKDKCKPWNPTNTVVLKRIKNPVPMYVKSVNLGVPEFERLLGFDLEKGDWVAPYGTGVVTDFVFYAKNDQRGLRDFDYTLRLTFANEKDGIQTLEDLTHNKGSRLKSDYKAPVDGYLSEWNQFRKRRPEVGETNNIDRNRIYYFHVRTKLDEQGNIISAQYGKIYGDFLQFTYYLNPTPNDRNVEFDPEKNLLDPNDRFAP